jgi:hypothetical protein
VKKELRKFKLHRETLHRLEVSSLAMVAGRVAAPPGGTDACGSNTCGTQQNCISVDILCATGMYTQCCPPYASCPCA